MIITVLCVINIILMLYLIYKLNAEEDYIVYKRPTPKPPSAPSTITGLRGTVNAGSAAAGFVNTTSKIGTV